MSSFFNMITNESGWPTQITPGSAATISASAANVGGSVNPHVALLDTNKMLVTYALNAGNSYAVIGTVSGNSISFGSAVSYDSANTFVGSAILSTTTAVVLADADIYHISVSGTTITPGASATLGSGTNIDYIVCAANTSTDVLFVYQDGGSSSKLQAQVASWGGASWTMGTKVEVAAGTTNFPSDLVKITSNKFLLVYRNSSGGAIDSCIITLSGTTVSIGAITTDASITVTSDPVGASVLSTTLGVYRYSNSTTITERQITLDTSANTTTLSTNTTGIGTYQAYSVSMCELLSGTNGYAAVTADSTNSLLLGNIVYVNSSRADTTTLLAFFVYQPYMCAIDSSAVCIVYIDTSDSNKPKAIVGILT